MAKTYQQNTFHFWGRLNRFLPKPRRYRTFRHTVRGLPSIKDTIQAIGVPHTEVDCILVDGKSVSFSCQTKGFQTIHVYPDASRIKTKNILRLKPKPLKHPRFICDAHLGKLVRHLRLLGLDCHYDKSLSDRDIVQTGAKEKRIILTRDIGLLKHKLVQRGYFVRAIDPDKQLKEILREFAMHAWLKRLKPFSRCLECNGKIVKAAKAKVMSQLPKLTKQYYHDFYLCKSCGKIYWKGAHHKKLAAIVKNFQRTSYLIPRQ